jgi:D-amino peptidase
VAAGGCEDAGVRVFVSADMEGVAGVVDWDQCRAGAPGYAQGCRLLLGEVNAAVLGALNGGATAVTVCDAHGAMANLPPDELAGGASYVSGRWRPDYMMSGLAEAAAAGDPYGAVLFVGYHGSLPLPSVLSHTYNPSVISDARIGGVRAGESGINAFVAAACDMPVLLVTGDQYVGPEAAPFCPGIRSVVVKQSLNRTSAVSLHPDAARAAIRAAASESVAALVTGDSACGPPTGLGDLEVDVFTADMAATAAAVRGVERTGERTLTIAAAGDPLAAYRAFTSLVTVTRGLTTA